MKSNNKLIVAIAAAVVILGGIYGGVAMHYGDRYLPHTTVLGVNIGGKTQAQANTALKSRFNKLTYRLKDGKKTIATASGTQLGIRRSFTKTLAQLAKQQNQWAWLGHALGGSGKDTTVDPVIDQTTLNDYAKTLTTKLNKSRKASADADLSFDSNGLQVKKEVYGTQLSTTKMVTTIVKDIKADKTSVQLNGSYIKPTVTTKSKKFVAAKTKLQKLVKISGKVTIEDHSVTITRKDLYQWLSYKDGQVEVSNSGVYSFVKAMNTKYSTYGKTRTFKSTKRGTVKVPGGTYGWIIMETPTTNDVIKAIKKGKNFTVKATYKGSGYHADGTDIGNTYVEVDIQNQHEYYYKDGKLTLDSDVVTGKPSTGDSTPVGVDYVWNKETNATLRGTGDSGESYATKVSYWMPIDYTGVGLHDASWQPKFGGDWYLTHGSNGCVNNPPSFMPKLYAAVALGTPVIVF